MFVQMLLLAQAVASLAGTAPSQDDIDLYNSEHQEEAARLEHAQGLAERSGQTLTISYHGRPVATLSDVNPYGCYPLRPCETWTFGNVLWLRSTPDQPAESYPLVLYNPGEGGKLVIVDHDGSLIWIDFPLLDGQRYVASGSFLSIHTPEHFFILDWASAGHSDVAVSGRPCEPLEWRSEFELMAACQFEERRERLSLGVFKRRTDGAWSFVPEGWTDELHIFEMITKRRRPEIKGPSLPSGFVLKRVDYRSLPLSKPGTLPAGQLLGYRQMAEKTAEMPISIGTATMADDGAITFQLWSQEENGTIAEAVQIYRLDDPEYKYILDHLGGLKRGESKSIPPFVD